MELVVLVADAPALLAWHLAAEGLDLMRLGRFTLLGTVLVAPTLHLWCAILPLNPTHYAAGTCAPVSERIANPGP